MKLREEGVFCQGMVKYILSSAVNTSVYVTHSSSVFMYAKKTPIDLRDKHVKFNCKITVN